MPFARMPATRAFPGRVTVIDVTDFTVESPMTFLTARGRSFVQSVAFEEVGDELAEELREVGYRTAYPVGDNNPERFELVATRDEADAIEQRDRERLVRDAKGRRTTTIGKAA
jgi:hypothetical protein